MGIKKAIHDLVETIRAINKKYAKPALKTNKATKVALFCLRLYLLLLVGLLFFKLFVSIKKG
ncbi:MAG: hypothetical protein HQL13_00985 [Candidatus Omnitrophica bacterium]|nr:hypothetical protein [Candidatus Omnitrophota bacterium]